MKFRFLLSTLVILVYQLSMAQSIFTNDINDGNPSSSDPYTHGQIFDPNISVSGIGRGAGITANAGADRYNANSWNTASLDPTAYFEFTLTPNSGYNINLVSFVYTGQKSGSGPASFAFRSSVDSYAANIGTPTATGATILLSAAAYQNIAGPITFRLYGWGASGAGGTYSVNDFTFNGTVEMPGFNPEIDIVHTVGPGVQLHASTYDFGPLVIGSQVDMSFDLNNIGQANLTFAGAPTVTGSPRFILATPFSTAALATGTRTFVIRFQPIATGSFTGSITFNHNDVSGGENPYVINFTGVGVPPTPEINVRAADGGGNNIADGSTIPNGPNNTLFPATNIGASSLKTYRIENLGTGLLTLTAPSPYVTISGANAADFTLSAIPAGTIANGSSSDFQITFTPSGSGVRTAVVTIANNDSNENPYNFVIQGTGNCLTATNTITPSSGPVGTEVTITSSANNLTGATVTIGGIAAVVTPISATQIKAIVPVGATSGSIITTNSQGCSATNAFTVIKNAISGCQGGVAVRSQLFISEVTDHGSGSHSYVEIFNATGATVNLLNYTIRVHNNGAAAPTSTIILPSFPLLTNTAYVVAFGTPDQNDNPGSITPNLTDNASGINNNDNIRLHDSGGTWIDLWGNTSTTAFTISPNNYHYQRKNSGITAPSTTWNPGDWIAATPVDYSDIGLYDFSTGTPPNVAAHPSFSPSCQIFTSLTVAGTEGFTGGNPLAYQWYVAAPGATTWSLVSNSALYSGATLATLYISNVSTLDGYQFYVQVRENSATCYSASNATMIKVSSSVWNAGAWTPSAPTIVSGVTINGNYDTATHGSFDACSVTVSNGATLTIAADDYVLIQANLTVNTGGSLMVSNDGSLVMINNNGVVTNNGSMQVVRTTTPYKKYDYTYWSSPIFTANIGSTFPDWRTDYSFTFNTANFSDLTGVGGMGPADGFDDNNNAWTPAPSATTMVRAKGYAIMAPTTGPFPATSTVTFSGRVNNGIITLPMALSANAANVNDDFNLIGNPYPSAVDGNLFINSNSNISGTLYFWTHTTAMSSSAPGPGAYNFITADYAMYNLSGGTASGSGSSMPTGKIASGQGFFVEAVSAGNVTFNNAMRNKNHDNADFFRANQGVRDRLWLNFENLNGLFSQQLIGYFNESTNDADWGYDGIINPTQNSVSFYSLINDDTYRIQGRAPFTPTDMVPLGYKSVAGQFSISIGNIEGQLANVNTNVFLEDLALGNLHDLKQSPYTFSTEAGTFNDRFVLRYLSESLSTIDILPLTGLHTAVRNQQLSLRSSETIVEVILYDMMGRKIYEAAPNATEFTTNVIATKGAVVARIKLADGQTANRKIIF